MEKRELFAYKLKGQTEDATVEAEDHFLEDEQLNIDDEEFSDDYGVEEDDGEFVLKEVEEQIGHEITADETTVEEDMEENSIVVDFDAMNSDFNEIYKAASVSERTPLKGLKADMWEVEMKQEEIALSIEDVQVLAYSILEVDAANERVMKWQIASAKQLLNSIVKR